MKRCRTYGLSLLTGISLFSAAGVVGADEGRGQSVRGGFLLAEILVPAQPDNGKKTSKAAAEARAKARAYQESESGSTSGIVVPVPENEEEGLFGSRRQPESGASVNRAKARQYQQGQVPAQIPLPAGQDSGGAGPTTAERAQESRAKARSYVSTDNTVVIERIGSDGIPIVACGKLVSNVAGRIGDDMQPGAIFFIMRDNKPFKVRCAE